jgi:hypothetical protein
MGPPSFALAMMLKLRAIKSTEPPTHNRFSSLQRASSLLRLQEQTQEQTQEQHQQRMIETGPVSPPGPDSEQRDWAAETRLWPAQKMSCQDTKASDGESDGTLSSDVQAGHRHLSQVEPLIAQGTSVAESATRSTGSPHKTRVAPISHRQPP